MHRFVRRTTHDPFLAMAATYAWRADDAVDNGAVTTSIPNYVGPTMSLPRQGAAGQAVKSVSAALNSRQSIAFSPAGLAYGNVAIFSAAPASVTIASVVRVSATNCGWAATTAAGAPNTGTSQLHISQFESRKAAVGSAVVIAAPANAVIVSVITAAGIATYANSRTPVSADSAGSVAGTTWHLGALDSANTFTLNGEWATTGVWNSALSHPEVVQLLVELGRGYGVTITA
jgi:hypothetical protein